MNTRPELLSALKRARIRQDWKAYERILAALRAEYRQRAPIEANRGRRWNDSQTTGEKPCKQKQ